MQNCSVFNFENEILGKINLIDIQIIRKRNNTIFTSRFRKKKQFYCTLHYIELILSHKKKTLKTLQCITSSVVKICSVDYSDLELKIIYKIFFSLGYPETVVTKRIKTTQSKVIRLPSLGLYILAEYFPNKIVKLRLKFNFLNKLLFSDPK